MINMAVFLLLAAAAATALGAGVYLICNDYLERGVARRRAGRDHDEPGSHAGSELGRRVRLFTIGLVGSSLLTLPIDLGFAGTFTVILFGSFSFSLAPDLLGRAAGTHRYGETMHSILTLMIGLSLATLCGCESPSNTLRSNQLKGSHNMWVGGELSDRSVQNAITAERCVFEHHFVPGTAELNPLGLRDLELLADHFREYGGDLDVRRGQADEDL